MWIQFSRGIIEDTFKMKFKKVCVLAFWKFVSITSLQQFALV